MAQNLYVPPCRRRGGKGPEEYLPPPFGSTPRRLNSDRCGLVSLFRNGVLPAELVHLFNELSPIYNDQCLNPNAIWVSFFTSAAEKRCWLYKDKIFKSNNPLYPVLPLKKFLQEFFIYKRKELNARFPKWFLFRDKHRTPNFARITASYSDFKKFRDFGGCMVLDPNYNHVLMVQSFGHNTWTFPGGGGKRDEGESFFNCAKRELLEETSVDVTGLIQEDTYVEREIPFEDDTRTKTMRLYFVIKPNDEVPDVPDAAKNEIKDIKFQPVLNLLNSDVGLYRVSEFYDDLTAHITSLRLL